MSDSSIQMQAHLDRKDAEIESLRARLARLARLRDAAKMAINDVDTYLDWARSHGRSNSELKRIGSQLRAAIAESEVE